MKILLTTLLIGVGLINLLPLMGVISPQQVSNLYGISPDSVDTVILLRHRAVLFGLLGAFIIYSAAASTLRILACVAGLISMLAFIALMIATPGYGEPVFRVAVIDGFASLALLFVLFVELRQRKRRV